ncbi:MAG: hypothetical protein WA125_17025 [Desulfosporosinus sp.]
MALTLITKTQRYACLSMDVKTTTGVDTGSLCKETDTGNEFIFNGATWVAYSQTATIVGGALPAGAATQTTLAALLAKVIAAPATEAKQDALVTLIGTLADAAVIDPTAAGSVIAELKGIVKQMQGTGTAGTSMPVTVNGSLANITGAIQNVTTAGTRVQLPNVPCRVVTVTAKRANTGYIYIGGSNVSSAVYGDDLASKESFTLEVANVNQIYIDASVSGEGISYVAL